MSGMQATSMEPRSSWSVRALLHGNVLWLSVVSLLNDAASEMIYPLLPLFLVGALGATPAFLGVIEGIAESTASLLKLGSGYVSDRAVRRKPFILWGYGVAAVVRPLIGVVSAPWHVLVVRFTDRIGKGLRSAPRDALLTESVPPHVRGTAFGLHRAADHAGAVIGPLIATVLLLIMPGNLRAVFLLALVPGVISLFVIARCVHDAPRIAPVPAAAPAAPLLGRIRESARGPLARYLLVVVLFTLGNATDAFLLLRARDLGVAVAAIPLLWSALHLSKLAWNVVGGMIADRFGARRAIVAGWLLYAATYCGFAFASSAWHVWALFLGYGLFYGLTEAPEKALVAQLSGAQHRGTAFGAYHLAVGVAALPASVIFGAVWTVYGAPAAFLLGAVLALAAAVLLPLAARDGEGALAHR